MKRDTYTAALVIIGNEILSGRTQDTNTSWIAERLTQRGVIIREVRIIPDIADIIIRAVNDLRERVDYVFTTGGIGPTHDDITAESVARAFGVEMEKNDKAYAALEAHYGAENLTSARARMSMIPMGASLISNPVSGAPGFILGNVYVMAGVPRIMQSMLDQVIDMLELGKPMLSNTVSCNLPESDIAEDLRELQGKFEDVEMGSYPHYRGGVLGLSLVLRSIDGARLGQATDALIEVITRLGDHPRAVSIQSDDSKLIS